MQHTSGFGCQASQRFFTVLSKGRIEVRGSALGYRISLCCKPVPAGWKAGIRCFLLLPIKSARPICFKASAATASFSADTAKTPCAAYAPPESARFYHYFRVFQAPRNFSGFLCVCVHRCGNGHRRRQEICTWIKPEVVSLKPQRQIKDIQIAASRMCSEGNTGPGIVPFPLLSENFSKL